MRSLFSLPAVGALLFGGLSFGVQADSARLEFRTGTDRLTLKTGDARQQVLVTGDADRDLTRSVRWAAEPAGILEVDARGVVRPLTDGTARLSATTSNGVTASLTVVVQDAQSPAPVHFANQIVPIFTKNGCNGGGCHGKAAGQNGFRLSLLGFEPAEDYEHLVKEARGRRLFPAAPERSLLLTKGTAELPHGGGKRLDPDSADYELLLRWIRLGMPQGRADAPTVARLEAFPAERTLPMGAEQQLVVTAHYTDGSTEDVTRSALFEPNEKDLASCDDTGLLRVQNQTGEVGVMVRYQGKVTTFRATIPLGAPVDQLPPARGFVDELVFKQLRRVGMPPSEICDDSTFLRRVTLDLAGRLPTPAEVTEFLAAASTADPAAASDAAATAPATAKAITLTPARVKARDAVIERLVASGDYAEYFAQKWSALLRNRRSNPRQQRGTYAFHAWIRDSLATNQPYDQFVRAVLTASGDVAENPPVAWFRQVRTLQTQLEDVSQLFLGQRMQCAQCHHHPYEKWSQNDYWGFGAFFSQVSYKPGQQPGEEAVVHKRGAAQATNKKNGQAMKPAGLATPAVEVATEEDPRDALADWMTSPQNPWFAKALVNRYWKHFFGRGLVDPEDDMRETNPPTNPELLDALARHFVEHHFDLRDLVTVLARSTTYQLSAEPNAHNARDRFHFARFYPRRLPAEVLYDSVNALTGNASHFDGLPTGTRAVCLPDNSFNASSYFLTVFGRPESSSACECERSMEASLSQSLHLLNSKDLQTQLGADGGRAAQLATDSSRSDTAKFQELYQLALARSPRPDELQTATAYLTKRVGGAPAGKDEADSEKARVKARREAFEDTLWALLNSKEFLFNH